MKRKIMQLFRRSSFGMPGSMKFLGLFLAAVTWICLAPSLTRATSGDLNCDSAVNFNDINPFVLALANSSAYEANFPNCSVLNGDLDGDGSVSFGDINPFVAKIAQCAANQPPIADAGADQQGIVAEPMTFDGGGSSDLNAAGMSYQWSFGDGSPDAQGMLVTHSYGAPGTYFVSLNVTDPCGANDSDSVTVVVVESSGPSEACCLSNGTCLEAPPADCLAQYGTPQGDGLSCEQVTCAVAPLQAAFIVQKLEAEDADGTLHYRTIDLEEEPLEYGVRYRFDASPSQGVFAEVSWDFGDGTFGYGLIEEHSFVSNRHVTLTVYDATWENWSEAEADITAAQPIHRIDQFDSAPGHEFTPVFVALDGDKIWAHSSYASLGVGSIADPYNLTTWTILIDQGMASNIMRIAVAQNALIVAEHNVGVGGYQKDPFVKLSANIPLASLGGRLPISMAAKGDILYAATDDGRLLVYDSSNIIYPGGNFEFVTSFDVAGYIQDVIVVPQNRLAAVTSEGKVLVFNITNPASPILLTELQVPSGVSYKLAASSTMLGVRTGSGTAIFWFDDIFSSPLPLMVDDASTEFALTDNRLYIVSMSSSRIYKYDLARRSAPAYRTEMTSIPDCAPRHPFFYDPDGIGPLPQVLMVSHTVTGYSSYTP